LPVLVNSARNSRAANERWSPLTLLVLGLAAYFLAIALSNLVMPNNRLWHLFGVVGTWPPFADLRNLLAGIECQRLGYDVLVENPCDQWLRPVNYPRIWLHVLPSTVGQGDALPLALLLSAAFFAGILFFWRGLPRRHILVYAAALFSPAVMLGVERANNDLAIVLLVAAAAELSAIAGVLAGIAAAILVFVAAVAKLYPGASAIVLLMGRTRIGLTAAVVAATALYVWATLDDIRTIALVVPHVDEAQYGIGVMLDMLLRGSRAAPIASGTAFAAAGALEILVMVGALLLIRSDRRIGSRLRQALDVVALEAEDRTMRREIALFTGGAACFVASYLIGWSFYYRLALLLLVLPFLLRLCGVPASWAFGRAVVAMVIGVLWMARTALVAYPLALAEQVLVLGLCISVQLILVALLHSALVARWPRLGPARWASALSGPPSTAL
jgi:hypothetical protein